MRIAAPKPHRTRWRRIAAPGFPVGRQSCRAGVRRHRIGSGGDRGAQAPPRALARDRRAGLPGGRQSWRASVKRLRMGSGGDRGAWLPGGRQSCRASVMRLRMGSGEDHGAQPRRARWRGIAAPGFPPVGRQSWWAGVRRLRMGSGGDRGASPTAPAGAGLLLGWLRRDLGDTLRGRAEKLRKNN